MNEQSVVTKRFLDNRRATVARLSSFEAQKAARAQLFETLTSADYINSGQAILGDLTVQFGKAAFNTAVDTAAGFASLGLLVKGGTSGRAFVLSGGVGLATNQIKFQGVDPTIQLATDVASYVSGGVGLVKAGVKLANLGVKALPKIGDDILSLPSNSVRFSQSSISFRTNNGQFLGDLIHSIKTTGFRSDKAINVVRQADEQLTSLDNRRLFAAQKAGVDVKAIIRNRDDLLTSKQIKQFSRVGKPSPKTFGDAIDLRITNQRPRSFVKSNPYGSFEQPFVSLGKNKQSR